MATKVCSARPGGKVRRYIIKPTLDQRLAAIRRELGLDNRWENLKLQVKIIQR